ncbi:MAG: ZIP family metal transporter [Hyphomicrobium sp.]|nr:ZIP family metal transporter [Hyphomicrobium sp.]
MMLGHDVAIVFLAALATAIATGLGALPLIVFRRISASGISIANAAAAGLMMAATYGLIAEGLALSAPRLLAGLAMGLAAIVIASRLIGDVQSTTVAGLAGLNARKALLIIGVMTAHSFAEGVGVGVSFAGSDELATFITAAIAIHNIPEGLAISLVLVPRGTPVWQAALWSIFTSLPQPIAAVPSYLAVETFAPLLPIGLGVAAGAMMWMIFAELIPDAGKATSPNAVGVIVTLSFAAMMAFQYLVLKS